MDIAIQPWLRYISSLMLTVVLLWGCASAPTSDDQTTDVNGTVADTPATIAVVLSGEPTHYQELKQTLATYTRWPMQIFEVNSANVSQTTTALHAFKPTTIIAVGRQALDLAQDLPDAAIIYAQVFAPPDQLRGVNALPAFEEQFALWKQMSPELQRIGVIAGPNLEPLVEELRTAAQHSGLRLNFAEANSDKSALLAFRAMLPELDGFVMLPDHRILSPDVIRRITVQSKMNNCQMLVYSPAMFQLGATLYIRADQSEIAEQLAFLLENPQTLTRPLTRLRVEVNHQGLQHEPS